MPIVGSEFENIVGRELGEIVCTFVPPCNRIIIVSKFAFNFPHSLLSQKKPTIQLRITFEPKKKKNRLFVLRRNEGNRN